MDNLAHRRMPTAAGSCHVEGNFLTADDQVFVNAWKDALDHYNRERRNS